MTYINSNGDTLVEQPGAQLQIDAWGLDSIARKYVCKADDSIIRDALDYFGKLRNKADDVFRALTLTTYTVIKGRSWAEFSVNFKGVLDGRIPAPVYSGGMATQSVQLEWTDTATQNVAAVLGATYVAPTTQLTYKAPFVNIRYFLRARPETALHENDIGGREPVIQVVNQTGARGRVSYVPLGQPRIANVPVVGTDPATGEPYPLALPPVENSFNAITNIVSNGPEYTQEGQFYLCEEKNQVTLMPFSFASLIWKLNVNEIPA